MNNYISWLFDWALRAVKAQRLDGLPEGHHVYAVPNNVEYIDLTGEIDRRVEERASGPRRINGTETTETLDSFIRLVSRHRKTETVVKANTTGQLPTFTAVIDYHGESVGGAGPVPAWKGQSVHYAFPFTKQFAAWLEASRKPVPKREFLRFVDTNIRHVVDPIDCDADDKSVTRAVFLEVLRARGESKAAREAKGLEALFGSAQALLDGVRGLNAISEEKFEEEESGLGDVSIRYAKTDKITETVKVREFYLVEAEIFQGSDKIVIPARLRASVAGGALSLRLELLEIQRFIDSAFAAAEMEIAAKTGCPVYRST